MTSNLLVFDDAWLQMRKCLWLRSEANIGASGLDLATGRAYCGV